MSFKSSELLSEDMLTRRPVLMSPAGVKTLIWTFCLVVVIVVCEDHQISSGPPVTSPAGISQDFC